MATMQDDYWGQFEPMQDATAHGSSAPLTTVGQASSTQSGPVPSAEQLFQQFQAQWGGGVPTNNVEARAFIQAFSKYAAGYGYQISAIADDPQTEAQYGPAYLDGMRVVGPDGRAMNVDFVTNMGGAPGSQGFAWQVDDGSHGGGGGFGGFGQFQTGMFTGGGQYPLASVMGEGLMAPWTTPFNAPGMAELEQSPGYQARMKAGTDAILRNKSAAGLLRTGGTLKDLTQFGQDFASHEYDKVYNRAMGEYGTAYNIFDRNQANQYGRLRDVAGMGYPAATGN
jgi:hypothetical protein